MGSVAISPQCLSATSIGLIPSGASFNLSRASNPQVSGIQPKAVPDSAPGPIFSPLTGGISHEGTVVCICSFLQERDACCSFSFILHHLPIDSGFVRRAVSRECAGGLRLHRRYGDGAED